MFKMIFLVCGELHLEMLRDYFSFFPGELLLAVLEGPYRMNPGQKYARQTYYLLYYLSRFYSNP